MSNVNLFDKVASALIKKAMEDAEKVLKNLDEFDKQILGICNTPRTDSHIKQMFRSRDAEDRTINIDHKIQHLLKSGILDHANTKYVVNPKYREFITVIPMSAAMKAADGDFEEEHIKLYEEGQPMTEEEMQVEDDLDIDTEHVDPYRQLDEPIDLGRQLHNVTYEYMQHIKDPKQIAIRVIDYFTEKGLLQKMRPKGEGTIADAIVKWVETARDTEEALESLHPEAAIESLDKMAIVIDEGKEAEIEKSSMLTITVNFIAPEGADEADGADIEGDTEESVGEFDTDNGVLEKESTDIGLGMGIVDRTEREENRESLISPKISIKIEGSEKKNLKSV